jgi:hypothetical protein
MQVYRYNARTDELISKAELLSRSTVWTPTSYYAAA